MLLHNGIFIDDWRYYDQSIGALQDCFSLEGWYYTGIWAIHAFIFSFGYPELIYHVLTFVLIGIQLFLLGKILQFTPVSNDASQLFLLFMGASPFYFMKNTANTFPYTLCLTFFFIAWLLLLKNEKKKSAVLDITASVLLFYSFITNSILVFFPILFLHLLVINRFRIIPFVKRYFWLPIVPALFLVVRYTILKPIEGSTSENYNVMRPGNLLHLHETIWNLCQGYLRYFYHVSLQYSLPFLGILMIFWLIIYRLRPAFLQGRISWTLKLAMLLAGVILFVIAVIPYAVVDKYPIFSGWDTRHQLLVQFGIMLFFSGIVLLSANLYYRLISSGILLTVFTVGILAQTHQYYKGWIKYESIGYHFRSFDPGEFNTLKVIDDEKCSNATDRFISYFEIAGLYKKATGKQDIYFVGIKQQELDSTGLQDWIDKRKAVRLMAAMNMADFEQVGKIGKLSITCRKQAGTRDILRFLYGYYFEDREQALRETSQCVEVKTEHSRS